MIKNILYILITLVALMKFSSCTEEARQRLEPTPYAVGSLNQVTVISDTELWEGEIGDSLSFYYGSAFPILPQPEPIFDLKHFTPEQLEGEPTRRELKVYLIIADISDASSPTTRLMMEDLGEERIRKAREDASFTTSMGHDRWAMNQIVIYLFANGQDKLKSEVVNKFPTIAKVIHNHYKNQIDASVYLAGENNEAINVLQGLGCYIKVPGDYRLVIEEEESIWLIRENEMSTSNIMVHKLPYTSQDQFSKENIIALQDTLGKRYISTSIEGSYMRTNSSDLPVFTQSSKIGNTYAMEARGIWEMQNDFLGGPFLAYLILDEKNNQLFFVDGFVLAPGEKKRNQMIYLEHIIQSFQPSNGVN